MLYEVITEETIEKERAALNDSGLMRGKLEGEINVLKEQINSSRGSEGHLQTRKDTVSQELEQKESEKEASLNEKSEIDSDLEKAAEIREEARESLLKIQKSIETFNAEIEVAKNAIITALNERAMIRSKMGRYSYNFV